MRVPAINLANALTVLRLLLVPAIIVAIGERRHDIAFALFVLAGLSDALDGYIARVWNQRTELGAHLDPAADKLLLVSIYVALAIVGNLPVWLTVVVVSRDVMIIGAVVIAWLMSRPIAIQPLLISKANTFAQIVLAGLVLATQAFSLDLPRLIMAGSYVVVVLTVLSIASYFARWYRHVTA